MLCAEGSISNAAKALDISSAAASKRLAQIEKKHGLSASYSLHKSNESHQ
ncbi:LysR family transcriptional regulator [Halomonas sp. KX33721]